MKFGDCNCTASEEDWTLVEDPDDASAPVATYQCQVCGELNSTTIEVNEV